jgi:DNA-binding MarR family transcriptional regulator
MSSDESGPRRSATDRPGLVLARSGQFAHTLIRKALGVTGLKPGHGHVLLRLSEDGAMSQQSLIEVLGVDPSVLVAILNDLERDGLASRRRDPADRRRHIVEMSDGGAALVTEIDAALTVVEKELFAGLTAAETATLHDLLTRIRTSEDACGED